MRIAVFDPVCGVSGNMILGALLDCGLERDKLIEMLGRLPLEGWSIDVSSAVRQGLAGTHVQVSVPEETGPRHLSHIRDILANSSLPESVKSGSLCAFRMLAEAESGAHGISADEVHFHEVGAMDAIVDIVGAFSGFHLLNIGSVHSTPVSIGRGTVDCAHGTLPVPAPATMRLLQGIPVVPTDIQAELTTPTGAAILKAAVDSWTTPPPAMVPFATGMGAGSRDLKRPNLLRITLGDTLNVPDTEPAPWEGDRCLQIRTVVDDMEGRLLPSAFRSFLNSGALDCWALPCIGRKGRPAQEITVLCRPHQRKTVLESLFLHTGTLGARVQEIERAVLRRDFVSVETGYGRIGVKTAYMGGEMVSAQPEYEDCAAAAEKHGVPVSRVIRAAVSAFVEGGD